MWIDFFILRTVFVYIYFHLSTGESKILLFHSYLLGGQSNKHQGSFLKKDDPKINALMQQAELLSSLALKVNTENTDQSLENAWKVRRNVCWFRYQFSASTACLGMFHQVSTKTAKSTWLHV